MKENATGDSDGPIKDSTECLDASLAWTQRATGADTVTLII